MKMIITTIILVGLVHQYGRLFILYFRIYQIEYWAAKH